ncbi:hypothetical protein EDB85DRAFT_1899112 [Lactarius pseudohatsudake]|nr:hypothetical protein EDB85DRAFT_1899112 [Lactarius pseudohatsudake]
MSTPGRNLDSEATAKLQEVRGRRGRGRVGCKLQRAARAGSMGPRGGTAVGTFGIAGYRYRVDSSWSPRRSNRTLTLSPITLTSKTLPFGMAATRDLERGQMSSNSRGSSPSRHPGRRGFNPLSCLPILCQEPPLDSPQGAEPRGGPSHLRVDVTVLRADNVPRLKNVFGLKFFVTVASQAMEMKTPSVPAKRRTARWSESLDALWAIPFSPLLRLSLFSILQPSTPLILCLYAERFARRDILIGTHEMIPVESQTDTPFVLTNGDGQAGQSVTLYLTVNVSSNTTSDPISPINAPIIQSTTVNDSPSGEAEEPSVAQESTDPTRPTIPTGPETLSPPTDRLLSSESTPIPPAADRRGVSLAVSALHGADEAMATINLSNKWEASPVRKDGI